jgi:hypothetical protein
MWSVRNQLWAGSERDASARATWAADRLITYPFLFATE